MYLLTKNSKLILDQKNKKIIYQTKLLIELYIEKIKVLLIK